MSSSTFIGLSFSAKDPQKIYMVLSLLLTLSKYISIRTILLKVTYK